MLDPKLVCELALRNPIGPPLPRETVEAWWDMVEARFDARRYRSRRRAVLEWWWRTTEHELAEALARAERIRAAALEEAAAQLRTPEAAPVAGAWRIQ